MSDGRFDELKVLEIGPLSVINFRREVIEPSFSAFLRSPEELFLRIFEQFVGNLTPFNAISIIHAL